MLLLAHCIPHGIRQRNHTRDALVQAVLKVPLHGVDEILIDVLHDDLHSAQGLCEDFQPLVPEAEQRRLKTILCVDDNGRDCRPFRIALEAIQTPNALLDLIRIPRQIDVDEGIRALEIAPLAPRHVAEHHAADGIVLKAVGAQLDLLCGHPRPEEADLLRRKDMCECSAIRLERLRVIREEHDLLIVELLAEQVDDGYEAGAARILMCIRIVQNIR